MRDHQTVFKIMFNSSWILTEMFIYLTNTYMEGRVYRYTLSLIGSGATKAAWRATIGQIIEYSPVIGQNIECSAVIGQNIEYSAVIG